MREQVYVKSKGRSIRISSFFLCSLYLSHTRTSERASEQTFFVVSLPSGAAASSGAEVVTPRGPGLFGLTPSRLSCYQWSVLGLDGHQNVALPHCMRWFRNGHVTTLRMIPKKKFSGNLYRGNAFPGFRERVPINCFYPWKWKRKHKMEPTYQGRMEINWDPEATAMPETNQLQRLYYLRTLCLREPWNHMHCLRHFDLKPNNVCDLMEEQIWKPRSHSIPRAGPGPVYNPVKCLRHHPSIPHLLAGFYGNPSSFPNSITSSSALIF